MRGSRAKRLRREFRERYGNAPQKTLWTKAEKGWTVNLSVWRMLKKLYKRGELKPEPPKRYEYTAIEPLEEP